MADDNTGGPRRVHYFNGQLLDESDFTAEQDYHVDMRRRLNRFMHGTGVAGDVGLRVRKEGDKRLRIGAGVAIDAQGREIVLVADRLIDLDAVKAKAGTTVFLTLAYAQTLELPVTDAGTSTAVNHRRTAEEPRIDFVVRRPPDGGDVLAIAAITIDAGGNVAEVDNTVRGFVGSVIDPKSEPTVRKLTVTGDQKVGGGLDVGADVEASANLRVAGNAELRGNVSARTLTVSDGADIVSGLKVQGACDLRSSVAVGVDLNVAGSLDVVGKARVGSVLMSSAGLAVGALVEQLRVVRGNVLSNAGDSRPAGGFAVSNSGPGWVVSKGLDLKTNKGLPGLYDVVFRPAFATPPAISLTPVHTPPLFKAGTAADFGGTAAKPKALEVIGFDNEKMRVRAFDPQTNTNTDMNFSFIVIGPQ